MFRKTYYHIRQRNEHIFLFQYQYSTYLLWQKQRCIKESKKLRLISSLLFLFSESANNYTKQEDTYCTNKGSISYTTFEQAKEACQDSLDCSAVSDTDCDNDYYSLCPNTTTLKSSSQGSCVYVKGKAWFQF